MSSTYLHHDNQSFPVAKRDKTGCLEVKEEKNKKSQQKGIRNLTTKRQEKKEELCRLFQLRASGELVRVHIDVDDLTNRLRLAVTQQQARALGDILGPLPERHGDGARFGRLEARSIHVDNARRLTNVTNMN